MYTTITGVLVGVIFYLVANRGRKMTPGIILSVIVFGCLSLLLSITLAGLPAKKWQLIRETKLATLRDSTAVSGSFYLASGAIGSDLYYFFYEKIQAQDNAYIPGKIKADRNVIIYETGDGGMLREYKSVFDNEKFDRWLLLTKIYNKYEFYIPLGSIRKDIRLDAE